MEGWIWVFIETEGGVVFVVLGIIFQLIHITSHQFTSSYFIAHPPLVTKQVNFISAFNMSTAAPSTVPSILASDATSNAGSTAASTAASATEGDASSMISQGVDSENQGKVPSEFDIAYPGYAHDRPCPLG
jgi:hypothetical protein